MNIRKIYTEANVSPRSLTPGHCRLVIDTLKVLTGGRKCYRSVGGVLVQQTVGTVLPTLVNNVEGVCSSHRACADAVRAVYVTFHIRYLMLQIY